ncbi:hypothetical protein [Achromobacter denitrificans]|uniref:Uncharacterized protein n=1 Tax=Achromobacter denitrificans TaxID=32002 RepID=A0ABZ3GFM5_ACHDE
MIRRLLRALRDRDNAVATLAVSAVLIALLFGYGDRQQRDEQAESTLTAQDGGRKTAVAARQP